MHVFPASSPPAEYNELEKYQTASIEELQKGATKERGETTEHAQARWCTVANPRKGSSCHVQHATCHTCHTPHVICPPSPLQMVIFYVNIVMSRRNKMYLPDKMEGVELQGKCN
ncbi:P1 nuclease, putative [Plasmodium ovale wallikeri]|uniref:p1 nuclease, putative n=1 Tax=Plasmodium ovale wallikeri TaxID=864142 RepID=A0A1A8YPH5_PLAOA|nr:P1 nuclease, putative [Plasmodium ovale wallikeri]SBT33312.1 P1 nuclease, putative [Plasmodium ovale wallikeri]